MYRSFSDGPAPRAPDSALRVAILQSRSVPGDLAENAQAAARSITEAGDRGARLVVFPELFLTGYELPLLAERPRAWLEDEEDPRLDPIRRAAVDTGATAILGAPFRSAAGRGFIAAPIITPDGRTQLTFKTHVHDSEAALFDACAASAPLPVDDWRVAVGICFDAAHPSHAEQAARDGADLYAVSALYMLGEERRCDLHLGARAMDNRMFTLLSNHAETAGAHVSCGLSGAWSPTGALVAQVDGVGRAMLCVDLDPAELSRFRS